MHRPLWWAQLAVKDVLTDEWNETDANFVQTVPANVLDMAQAIHESVRGQGDTDPASGRIHGYVRCLTWALGSWQPSQMRQDEQYDESVRSVCGAAVLQWRAWAKDRDYRATQAERRRMRLVKESKEDAGARDAETGQRILCPTFAGNDPTPVYGGLIDGEFVGPEQQPFRRPGSAPPVSPPDPPPDHVHEAVYDSPAGPDRCAVCYQPIPPPSQLMADKPFRCGAD